MARVAVAVVLLGLVAGCRSTDRVARTEVLLRIDAGPAVRADAERLRIELSSGPTAEMLEALEPEVIDIDADFTWPASLALVPRRGSTATAFSIHVEAQAGGNTITEVRAESAFLPGKTLVLELFLADECLQFHCKDDETCIGRDDAAVCVSSHVDPKDLPEFEPVGGAGGTSGAGGGEDDAGAADGGPARDGGAADGGAGDAGRDGGGGPSCVPTGAEDCFDEADDDCDGHADCADPDCDAVVVCTPAADTIGVLVSAGAACPAGYDGEPLVLHRGLHDAGCTGCGCEAGANDCTGEVYFYATTNDCMADTALTGGTYVGDATATCNTNPIGQEENMYTPAGWRLDKIKSSTSECTVSGTAAPEAPTWDETKKLCVKGNYGGGCADGEACVPVPRGRTLCGETAGLDACPKGTVASSDWYEGLLDTRTCGDCECAATGGGCDGVQVFLGSDYSCGLNTSMLSAGEQDCSATPYSPPAQTIGTPACEASAPESGALTAKNRHDLCCLP